MAEIDVIRPTAACAGTNPDWSPVPSGTLHGVTSDNSDSTYAEVDSSGPVNMFLQATAHTPSANHQRHRWRVRARARRNGAPNGSLDVGLGVGLCPPTITDTVNISIPSDNVIHEITGNWVFGAALSTAGSISPRFRVFGGGQIIDVMELYGDVDCRHRPDYSPEVRDGSGTDQTSGTVSDTNQPTLYFGGVAYDGLPALSWEVTCGSFSASGSGTPPVSVGVTSLLANGAYTAIFTVRSTIRGSDTFTHTQNLDFTVDYTAPAPSPPNITLDVIDDAVNVQWSDPGGVPWDNNYVVAEVFRTDCFGEQRIAVVPDGLNGEYLDRAIPQIDSRLCTHEEDFCEITYRIRYWGYVSSQVELPDTLPSQLILGWPGTVGTIPSGWSRVTALDGLYPRGSNAAVSGATGGNASHSHTTPGHTHSIGSHSHSVGGSTGTSNASTTSARFNGASQSQADQPHSHSRPSSTGTASSSNSGSSSPGTSSANNTPPNRSVIWIASDGTQSQYPTGVLGWSTQEVGGWTDDANSYGRYLRGATPGSGGGANSGSATHSHSINSHSHSGISHGHSLGNTGLSVPVGINAGFGSSSPPWLPRHTHPLTVGNASTGSTNSAGGGTSGSANHEPPNRRLRVIRNTDGGVQTRVIGLYRGDIAALDPLLVRCDGTNGTPDMRNRFARDRGADSVNSTGGSTTHSHSTPSHSHGMPSHNHSISVGTSNTGSFNAPSFGDLGNSPTTGHTHSSGNTNNATPGVGTRSSGTTNTVNHVPPYEDVHFVRLDGTVSGDPLEIPELRVSDFSEASTEAFFYNDGLDRLSSFTDTMAMCTTRGHSHPRGVTRSTPLQGGMPTVSTTIDGEDVELTISVKGIQLMADIEALLASDYIYYAPVGGTAGWFAPEGWSVSEASVGVRRISVRLVRQPWPVTGEPGDFL